MPTTTKTNPLAIAPSTDNAWDDTLWHKTIAHEGAIFAKHELVLFNNGLAAEGKLSLSLPKTKANSCLFCGEVLKTPSKCQYCGFKFCADHMSTDSHQCGKTRYAEYVRKTRADSVPNLASGNFVVVCETCGYKSAKGTLIEFAGEELIQHMQIVGCSGNTFLEEVGNYPHFETKVVDVQSDEKPLVEEKTEGGIVEQLAKLASLHERGVLSNDEFTFIKKEILKKLR